MHSLRTQLLLSHLMLIALMLVIMAGGVVSVWHLGRSVDRILTNNIKSVVAAQAMRDALADEDNAALLYDPSDPAPARRQFEDGKQRFDAAFTVQDHNITERGERTLTDEIGRQSREYHARIRRVLHSSPAMSTVQARDTYLRSIRPLSEDLRQRVQSILDVNEAAIQRADSRAKMEARTASWTGIGVAAVSFVVALLFAFRVVSSALAPLRTLARQAEEIGVGHLNQTIDIQRTDEIGTVADSFNHMTVSLREARRLAEERLHRAERTSDAALASLYDPVVVTDAYGRVVHLNRAAEGLFGPESESHNRPIADCVRDSRIADAVDRAIHLDHVSAAEGEAGMVALHVGEDLRTYRLRATPMRDEDGAMLGAVAVLEDVTHLRELDRLKTEFIGVASHELRTPVTSLLLSAQLLEEGAAGPLTPDQLEVIRAQKDDLKRLDRMMRDLLDLTRLEAGVTPPRFELVPPRELIDSAVEMVSAKAQAKGVATHVESEDRLPALRVDRAQMVRALVNLLDNAIRHTPPGGEVRIACRHADGSLTVAVSDTGSGIPADYLSRVFERFVQVEGQTQGGAGLGLSIAKTIVAAHGGDISVASELGMGATFTILLPVSARVPSPEPVAAGTAPARKEAPHGANPDC